MNLPKQYISPFVCGFGAAVLSMVPGLKPVACCILIPLAAGLSLFLEQQINKIEEPVSSRKAVTFGLLTGLFAALFATLFDTMLTLITRTNDFVETLPQTESLIRSYNLGPLMEEALKALKMMGSDIKNSGFSFIYTISILVSNLFTNSLFGLIGGFLGMNYLNKRAKK